MGSSEAASDVPGVESAGSGPAPGRHKIAVSGSTGLIGSALVPTLRTTGHDVLRLVRSPRESGGDAVFWDPARGRLAPGSLAGVHAAVHLAGVSVDARWSAEYKRSIMGSRVESTALLARTLAALDPRPTTLIVASAVGIYGDRGDEVLDEESPTGKGFLADVGRAWERAADPAREAGIRTVHTRFGVVLARGGGALAKMLPAFELGAGGKVAHGTQWMSWVTRTDAIAAVLRLLDDLPLGGPVNVTAPNPVTNAEFARVLGRVLRRPALATIPAFALRLMYGELADAALLASQRVLPRALDRAGFAFRYPLLEEGLRHELQLPVPGR